MFSDDLFYQKNTFKCPSKISQAVIYQYVIPFQYMGVITSAISGRVTSRKANYLPSYVPKIIELVNCYHDYDKPKNKLLQLLMEADLIVNKDTPIPVSLQVPFEQGGVFLCVLAELYAAAGVRRLSFVFA